MLDRRIAYRVGMRRLAWSLVLSLPAIAGAWPKIFTPPIVEQAVVTVEIAYPGAAPALVEHTIFEPVERALRGLPDVERVESSAKEGNAKLTLTVRAGADGHAVRLAVRARLEVLRDLPADSEAPIIRQVRRTAEVVTLRVRDPSRPGPPSPALVARLERRLVEVPQVVAVEVEAPPKPEIQVAVDPERAAGSRGRP